MDKKDFIKLINLLVDKKLKEILPNMVEQEVQKYMESGIEPDTDDYSSDVKNLIPYSVSKNPVIRDSKQMKKPQQTEGKKWSKNPVIDAILNQTAQNFTPLAKDPSDGAGSYQQLMESEYSNVSEDFTFNTNNMMDAITPKMPTSKPSAAVLKQQVIMDGAPPEIANIMVKDYSKVLKTMDKVAQQKRKGGIR